MDLRQLRQFVAVAEHLHFGRAAQALSMAQPPLSRTIRAIEQELGVALFERSKRKVLLAGAGRALLPEAKAVLAATARLADIARGAAAGEQGELVLSFVSIVDYSFLPELLRRFTRRFPGVRVDLREATTDVQLADLRAGRRDCGILLGPLSADSAESGGAARPGAPLALKALAGEAFICSPRHVALRLYDAIIGVCAAAGFSPRIVQEAIQMQTIISLVSAGMGVALVPESILSLKRPGVIYRRLRGARPLLEVGLAWRYDNSSAVLRNFVALAAQSLV